MSKSGDVIKNYAIDSLFGEGLFVRMDYEATKLLEHPWLRKDWGEARWSMLHVALEVEGTCKQNSLQWFGTLQLTV